MDRIRTLFSDHLGSEGQHQGLSQGEHQGLRDRVRDYVSYSSDHQLETASGAFLGRMSRLQLEIICRPSLDTIQAVTQGHLQSLSQGQHQGGREGVGPLLQTVSVTQVEHASGPQGQGQRLTQGHIQGLSYTASGHYQLYSISYTAFRA